MKCDKVRDYILTDYVDGQLEGSLKSRLEEHLTACSSCREFAQSVQKELVAPFGGLEKPEVPPAVWQNIKSAIAAEAEPEPGWKAVVTFLGNLQGLRQAAYLLAGVVIMLGLAVLLSNRSVPPGQIAREPVPAQQQLAALETDTVPEESVAESYLAYFTGDDYGDAYDLLDAGYGTAIEEYFL